MVVEGRARDLLTGPDGSSSVVGTAALHAGIDFVGGRTVTSISCEPDARLSCLLGTRASSGFRQRLERLLPGEDEPASLRYQLLDDLPTAVLVSGVAVAAAGFRPPAGSYNLLANADICAGWATGATILTEGSVLGYPPMVTGPDAPLLDGPGDAEAWHSVQALPPNSTRRRRRIDVWRPDGPAGPRPASIEVECFFRDSHADADGVETVIHEYTVVATLGAVNCEFLSVEARVGTLPWQECPLAAPSAARLVGRRAGDVRELVRDTFTGTSTCTHLNDTLRSLASVPYLVGRLADASRRDAGSTQGGSAER